MDTTYWGRDFGVMLFKDALTGEYLLWYFVKTETIAMYVKGVNTLLAMGYEIVGIVCDGRRGLLKAFGGIPVQICQFHQQKTVRKCLTSKPSRHAGLNPMNDEGPLPSERPVHWRIGLWLFLVGLLSSKARLRFAKTAMIRLFVSPLTTPLKYSALQMSIRPKLLGFANSGVYPVVATARKGWQPP